MTSALARKPFHSKRPFHLFRSCFKSISVERPSLFYRCSVFRFCCPRAPSAEREQTNEDPAVGRRLRVQNACAVSPVVPLRLHRTPACDIHNETVQLAAACRKRVSKTSVDCEPERKVASILPLRAPDPPPASSLSVFVVMEARCYRSALRDARRQCKSLGARVLFDALSTVLVARERTNNGGGPVRFCPALHGDVNEAFLSTRFLLSHLQQKHM